MVAPLSHAATEILGCLAPCMESGPHTASSLRRRTRLTSTDFQDALGELAGLGLVDRPTPEVLWLTRQGESWTRRLFA
jgi:hypothetical protein